MALLKLHTTHIERFKASIKTFKSQVFQETRGGHNKLPLHIQKALYDIGIGNSINTTDGRNERNVVKLSKMEVL